jgi:hypothetical protein
MNMNLDELLKQNAAWLEQALKRNMFDKVTAEAVNFPEEQRERREAELKLRIKDLSQRKEELDASYERAIELEKAELDNLSGQKPSVAPPDRAKPEQSATTQAERSRAKRAKRKQSP